MPKGTVKITAFLKEPSGVWEKELPVEYPDGAEKAIILQVLGGVRVTGLLNQISPTCVQLIPEGRVLNYQAELLNVALADNLDMARAVARDVRGVTLG